MASLTDFLSQNGGLLNLLLKSAAPQDAQTTGAPGDTADYSGMSIPAQASTVDTPQTLASQVPMPQPRPVAAGAAPTPPVPAAPGDVPNTVPQSLAAPAPAAAAPAPQPAVTPALQTNAFGQMQSGPLSTFGQNLARIIGNIPNGGMDPDNVVKMNQANAEKAQAATQRNQTQAWLAKNGVDQDTAAIATLPGHEDMLKSIFNNQLSPTATNAKAQQKQTADVLKKNGVNPDIADIAVMPGHEDMLKSVYADKFGPAKAPSSLGNGYVWNPNTEKVEQIYDADKSKTPIGFRRTQDGNLEPIPGGVADPAYIKKMAEAKAAGKNPSGIETLTKGNEIIRHEADGSITVLHKNEENAGKALSDDTAAAIASQWIAGNHEVTKNLPKSAVVQVREEITKQAAAAGLKPEDLNDLYNEQGATHAAMNKAGQMGAAAAVKAKEARLMIAPMEELSDKVSRGNWMPINKVVQAYQHNTSDPQLHAFGASIMSFVNAYISAVSNGNPTDALRNMAIEHLNTATGPEAFREITSLMRRELQNAENAPKEAIKDLRTGTARNAADGHGQEGTTMPKQTAPGTYSVGGSNYTVQKVGE